jgi:hypothetical protein
MSESRLELGSFMTERERSTNWAINKISVFVSETTKPTVVDNFICVFLDTRFDEKQAKCNA